MIVVDTNVISELWRLAPDPRVLAWMDAQAIETLHLSAVTVAELRYGIAAMPEGRRRTIYQERLEQGFCQPSPAVSWPLTWTRQRPMPI
jgi:predicted nucleic acid-binding protein